MHLFCDVSPDGTITDNQGAKIAGTTLIQSCCNSDVKLLWVASENKAEGYIKGFKAAGKRLNLVMTINRNRSKFPKFLEKLLSRMSTGETMPGAWVSISPQRPNDPHQQESPACIFAAGRRGQSQAAIEHFSYRVPVLMTAEKSCSFNMYPRNARTRRGLSEEYKASGVSGVVSDKKIEIEDADHFIARPRS